MSEFPKNFNVKLTLFNEDYSFGNGICKLLILIDELKSVNKACKELKMAYSKAYKMIQRAEKDLGFKILIGKIGGKNGGGSELTDEAYKLIEAYKDLNLKLNEFARKQIDLKIEEFRK